MVTPISFRNESHSIDFLRTQYHRFVHLRWTLDDLRKFSRSGEEILDQHSREAQESGAFSLSPFIVRGSILVMACGVLESFLSDLCKVLQEAEKYSVAPNDLRGSGVQRAQSYIKKVANLPFPDQGDDWLVVHTLFQLRHAIVHSGGVLTDKETIKKVRKLYRVVVSASGEVDIQSGAVEAGIEAISKFIDQLEQALVGPNSKQRITPRSTGRKPRKRGSAG